jgi:hypothetical protein
MLVRSFASHLIAEMMICTFLLENTIHLNTSLNGGVFHAVNMSYHKPSFWIAGLIIAASAAAVLAVYLRLWRIPFFYLNILGASNSPVHWFGWFGALMILATTLLYGLRKRAYHKPSRRLLMLHAFGNLIGFLLISIHFIHEVTRPASSYPVLGTGIVLYVSMLILVVTGFTSYFELRISWVKHYRFLHIAAAFTLLLVIIVHILHAI